MHSHVQANDPLLKPLIRQPSSAEICSAIPIKSILNATEDGKQPPLSSPQRTFSSLALPLMPNLEPYFHHSGGPLDSRPHPPPISPIKRNSENNVGTRSVGSAINSSTGAGFAMVSQLSVQKQQSRDYLSGGLDADAENSQTSGPDTPNSNFGSFRSSSAMPEQSAWLPPLVNPASQSPFMGMDPLSRTPSRMSGSRYGDDPHSSIAYPGPTDMLSQAGNHVQDGSGPMIPVTIDLKSGSRDQATRRKANSDASRRFRNRKKNEAALEQRINQLNEQLRFLTEERDFYRNERDFFRDTLGEHIGVAQMPPRPASPAQRRVGSIPQ